MSAPGTAARLDVLAPVLVVIGMVAAVAGPIFASSHVTAGVSRGPRPAAGRDGEPPLEGVRGDGERARRPVDRLRNQLLVCRATPRGGAVW